jgi:hypothetical protein
MPQRTQMSLTRATPRPPSLVKSSRRALADPDSQKRIAKPTRKYKESSSAMLESSSKIKRRKSPASNSANKMSNQKRRPATPATTPAKGRVRKQTRRKRERTTLSWPRAVIAPHRFSTRRCRAKKNRSKSLFRLQKNRLSLN